MTKLSIITDMVQIVADFKVQGYDGHSDIYFFIRQMNVLAAGLSEWAQTTGQGRLILQAFRVENISKEATSEQGSTRRD